MKLALFGLGKMGANMALRLAMGGHEVMGWSRTESTVSQARAQGVSATTSVEDAVATLDEPRVVWLMVPAGEPVDAMLATLVPLLDAGDIVVDGGNSRYSDTVRRADELAAHGLRMVDVGTSGGVWGLDEGYSLMIGGSDDAVEFLRPVFECLAPAPDRGWGHVGPSGAGHFVKMMHNAIEYGIMQAYAEGFAVMRRKQEFGLDLHQVAEIWRYGSVIRSWLLDLIADALEDDQDLAHIAPFVADSGEGRWAVAEAIELDQAAPAITLSLLQRLASRDGEHYADRLLAVMRDQFGGHGVKPAEGEADG